MRGGDRSFSLERPAEWLEGYGSAGARKEQAQGVMWQRIDVSNGLGPDALD